MKPKTSFIRFFINIVLPTLLSVSLFVITIFFVLIPWFENSMLDRKREMIRELTNSACSILEKYDHDVSEGKLSTREAQAKAIDKIRAMRYGTENKDYFWITDMHPIMIMHPYRSDLDSTDLSDFSDPTGKRLFVEFVNTVRDNNQGYVDYMWQWMDDSVRIVPKLSYVKRFEKWDWVIGTGIYIEDVKEEIASLEKNIIKISIGIIILMAILLSILIYQSLRIERKRRTAEFELNRSKEKYRTLVESATEGTLMVLNGNIIYSNKIVQEILGYNEYELNDLYFLKLLPADARESEDGIPFLNSKHVNEEPVIFETRLICKNNVEKKLELKASITYILDKKAFILKIKELSTENIEFTGNRERFRSLTDNIHIGVFRATLGKNGRFTEANNATLEILGYSNKKDLFETNIFNLYHNKDERNEFIREMLEKGSVKNKMLRLIKKEGEITAISISAMITTDEEGNATYCDGVLEDITEQQVKEEKREKLITELQTSMLYLNQPVKEFISGLTFCNMQTPLQKAAALMTKDKSKALLVTDAEMNPVGIITDHDIRTRALSKNLDTKIPVFSIMTSPLDPIPDTTLLFEAIDRIIGDNTGFLLVNNAEGRITGILTNDDLIRVQQYSTNYHLQQIRNASEPEALYVYSKKVPEIISALIDTGADAENINRVISTLSDTITEKLIEFAIAELGEPPAKYAFIAMGSEGREEQTLNTDQDNALIIEDISDTEKAKNAMEYFVLFGEKINYWMNQSGYKYCIGGIMAGNPKWCQTIRIWKDYFSGWINEPDPVSLLGISIFFDFRFISGEKSLVDELRAHVYNQLKGNDIFFFLMAENVMQYKPPLNFFGNIVTETRDRSDEVFDIKQAMVPLIGIARLYALKHQVSHVSTV
ncbi:MAG: DUF294 nucleotidyltransferase-like domain-containing protein, partial [Bacteroidota bacterium]